jgi:4'-phosphopantetheinyl transferase
MNAIVDRMHEDPGGRALNLRWVALDHLPAADEIGLLSADERAKAARFVFERDRRRYLAAHVALRRALAECVGRAPADLRFVTGAFGKPSLVDDAGWSFSLSHSGDVAVIALAQQGPIGVDLELQRDVPDALALAALNFTPSECEQLRALSGPERGAAFLQCWTRKEACLKAIGSGLSIPAGAFETGLGATRDHVVVPTDEEPVDLVVESLRERAGMFVAVAVVVAPDADARSNAARSRPASSVATARALAPASMAPESLPGSTCRTSGPGQQDSRSSDARVAAPSTVSRSSNAASVPFSGRRR